MLSLLAEAADFIKTLKQRVDKRAGECGKKYRRIDGSLLNVVPREIAEWMVDLDLQSDITDAEMSPLYLSDSCHENCHKVTI